MFIVLLEPLLEQRPAAQGGVGAEPGQADDHDCRQHAALPVPGRPACGQRRGQGENEVWYVNGLAGADDGRLLEPLGYVPPAEYEARYYEQAKVA